MISKMLAKERMSAFRTSIAFSLEGQCCYFRVQSSTIGELSELAVEFFKEIY